MRVTHEWFTAMHDAYTAGSGDIAAGEVFLREHYLAEGWTHVNLDTPGWGNAKRNHGYRRVYASRPLDRADRLRARVLRSAMESGADAYGTDGDLSVGVALGERILIVTIERRPNGHFAVIDSREVEAARA